MTLIGYTIATFALLGAAGIAWIRASERPVPRLAIPMLLAIAALSSGAAVFDQLFFYAEPGYVYHVRTITGQEKVISGVGYNAHLFGRYNAWKLAMTVQAIDSLPEGVHAESESHQASATIPPLNIMFLDQVDANAQAMVRFSIPTNRDAFLRLAHEYRSPENLLRTGLIPAFQETLQATASLMSAEDYYSGGRTQFNSEFEKQMATGIYVVRREEVLVQIKKPTSATANAALGTAQVNYGDDSKVIFVVNRMLDESGIPIRKHQTFTDYGIQVVDARITEMKSNKKFVERMQLKQKASADRAIAREQRIQEEEQRLLAISRGEREVAERQAEAKVAQILRTTEALTEKQLAITQAEQMREEALIAKQTSEIQLEKARIDAQTRRTLADAQAYEKQSVLAADNALAQKLEAEVRIHELWAGAYAKRQVPTNVFGVSSAGSGGVPVGSDQEVRTFLQLLTLDAAKRLQYDRGVGASLARAQ